MTISKMDFIPRYELSVSTFLPIVYFLCLTPIVLLTWSEIVAWRTEKRQPKGCRKLGLSSHSNLYDEYRDVYFKGLEPGEDPNGQPKWRLKALMIHPIKSCKEVELHQGTVLKSGMQYDRQFCFAYLKPPSKSPDGAQEEQWNFITRRDHAKLALVKVEIWIPDGSTSDWTVQPKEVQSGGALVVSFPTPGFDRLSLLSRVFNVLRGIGPETTFHVPLNPAAEDKYPLEQMKIWKDSPVAMNMGRHVPATFRDFLGIPHSTTLFRVDPNNYREVYRCAPRKDVLGYQAVTGFADAYPLHLMGLASVRQVGERVKKEIPRLSVRRFRSNFIITGPEAFAEDHWKRIRIGKAEFYVSCRTARCKLPNVDPDTGEKHIKEPDSMMRSFRQIDEGAKLLACLGMQMVPAKEESLVTVGDEIEVLETGEHFYLKQ